MGVVSAPRCGVEDLGHRGAGGLTLRDTMFTIGVAVCVEELGVSSVLPDTIVNDGGNMHAMEVDSPNTGDIDRLPSIGVLLRPRCGRPGVILLSIR